MPSESRHRVLAAGRTRKEISVAKPKIIVASTGGTIASKVGSSGGYAPQFDAADLLSQCPAWLGEKAELIPLAFCNKLSFALTPEDIFSLVKTLESSADEINARAIVVTQGTASIEETSFLAGLLWRQSRPLIFTGAMRNASHPGWDGPGNLTNSILTALNPDSAGQGALVCMHGEIFASRDVAKQHKSALNAFGSYNSGPLGYVSGARAEFLYAVKNRIVLSPPKLETRVELVSAALGTSGLLVDAAVQAGARAVALEVFPGGGGMPQAMFDSVIRHLADGIIFTLSPRSPMGSDNYSQSAGGSGPFDLRRHGAIPCGNLPAQKARLFLMAALPCVLGRDGIERLLADFAP
jgi:L-asparaginase